MADASRILPEHESISMVLYCNRFHVKLPQTGVNRLWGEVDLSLYRKENNSSQKAELCN